MVLDNNIKKTETRFLFWLLPDELTKFKYTFIAKLTLLRFLLKVRSLKKYTENEIYTDVYENIVSHLSEKFNHVQPEIITHNEVIRDIKTLGPIENLLEIQEKPNKYKSLLLVLKFPIAKLTKVLSFSLRILASGTFGLIPIFFLYLYLFGYGNSILALANSRLLVATLFTLSALFITLARHLEDTLEHKSGFLFLIAFVVSFVLIGLSIIEFNNAYSPVSRKVSVAINIKNVNKIELTTLNINQLYFIPQPNLTDELIIEEEYSPYDEFIKYKIKKFIEVISSKHIEEFKSFITVGNPSKGILPIYYKRKAETENLRFGLYIYVPTRFIHTIIDNENTNDNNFEANSANFSYEVNSTELYLSHPQDSIKFLNHDSLVLLEYNDKVNTFGEEQTNNANFLSTYAKGDLVKLEKVDRAVFLSHGSTNKIILSKLDTP